MENKQLEQLFKLCRKYGIKHFKSESVELHFDDEPRAKEVVDEKLKTETTYSDEDLLFWSAGN